MLEHSQGTATSRMLEPRLQCEHLPDTERESFWYRDIGLGLPGGQVARVQDRTELVPTLRWRRLDDARDRSIQQQREKERRRNRLVRLHARIRILQALQQQLLDQTVGVRRDVGVNGWEQCREQSAPAQYIVAACAVTCQEQLQGLVEQARGRHPS